MVETFKFMGETYGTPDEHQEYIIKRRPNGNGVQITLRYKDDHPEENKRGLSSEFYRSIDGYYSSPEKAIEEFYEILASVK